jgi:hypothetical protein
MLDPKEQNPKKPYRSEENSVFSLRINKITSDPRRSPPSLPHLIIGMKNEFLAHFYSRKCKNESWEVARSPIPLWSY